MHDYLGTVKAVDESVAALLKYLDERGLAENTLVVYASDQGFFSVSTAGMISGGFLRNPCVRRCWCVGQELSNLAP